MSAERTTSRWALLAGYLVLLFFVVLMVGLLSTRYSAGLALLLGVLLAWLARRIFLILAPRLRSWGWRRLSRVALAALGAFIVLSSLVCLPWLLLRTLGPTPGPVVERYTVVIERTGLTGERFTVREEVVVDDTRFSLPEREVASRSVGFLVREVSIVPLEAGSSGRVTLTLPDGTSWTGRLCAAHCPESRVELRDFPTGCFYDAKGAEDQKSDRYLDMEAVTWSARDLERGITFAYIPPPYHHVRRVLGPFIGASSLGQWVIGLLGIIGTLIVSPIVKPVVTDIGKGKLKSWLERAAKKKPSEEDKGIESVEDE